MRSKWSSNNRATQLVRLTVVVWMGLAPAIWKQSRLACGNNWLKHTLGLML